MFCVRIWLERETPTEGALLKLGRNPEKTLKSHSLPSAKRAVKEILPQNQKMC